MNTQRQNLEEIIENYKESVFQKESEELFFKAELEKFNIQKKDNYSISKHLDWSKINMPSLKNLVWRLDREIWAKVESKEATTSWGREQSALLILKFLSEFEQINLEEYSKFLEEMNYLDSDWRDEQPTTIEQFKFKNK